MQTIFNHLTIQYRKLDGTLFSNRFSTHTTQLKQQISGRQKCVDVTIRIEI